MAVGITIVKSFRYRADLVEEWSNKYHLTGVDPADATAWTALFDALVAQEKTVYPAAVSVVGGYGYTSDASTAHAVWSRDLRAPAGTPVPGTLAVGTGLATPGDVAATIRWKTSRLTVKGKPIYLRKYFHGALASASANNQDYTYSGQLTALNAFATKLWDGTFLDARKIRAAGQSSETIVGSSAATVLTVRTLKRRGKRPGT